MILSKTAIKRGVTFLMIYLIIIGFGLFSLTRLKTDLFPDVTFPVIGVITQYEGVGPIDMETLVTRPLEEAVSSVENIKTINSSSSSGTSIMILEFDWGTDMNQAEIDVRKNIDISRDALPDGVTDPITFAFNPSMQPIAFLALTSDKMGQAELRKVAHDKLEARLERIAGVGSASTEGGLQRQINVKVNPRELAAKGVDINQIVNAIRMENLQIPGGQIEEGMSEFSVRSYGEYQSVDQIKKVVVGLQQGTPIYLEDVANVSDGYKELKRYVRNNGKPSVILQVMKRSDANTVNTTEAVLKAIPDLENIAGQDVKVSVIYDLASFINKSISNLMTTALEAFLLAGIVLLFFLRNIRSAIIVAISIPVSVIATFFVMDQAGVTLNIISMAGLALAIGMLVDNSIVVLENIFRMREEGMDIVEAADEGTSEVSMAIIASTLTTLAVFIPILFVPGIAGVLFNDMAITIVFSLTASLFVALTLIPLMASRFLRLRDKANKSKIITSLTGWTTDLLASLDNYYQRALAYSLRHKAIVLITAVVLLAGSFGLLKFIGGEFLPQNDESQIQLSIERAPGTNLESTRQTFEAVEKEVIKDVPEAQNIYFAFGTGDAFSALFGTAAANKGQMMIRLSDIGDRDRSQFTIQDSLREHFKDFPGVTFSFDQGGGNIFGGKPIQVKIKGYDLDIGRELADLAKKKIEAIDGVVDVGSTVEAAKPEYRIQFDRDRLSSMGLTTSAVARAISSYIGGTIASRYRDQGDEYDIFVQLQQKYRRNKQDLEDLFITTPTGKHIPLDNVAKIVRDESPVTITRENQERVYAVDANYTGGDLQGKVDKVKAAMQTIHFPPGFRWEIGGTAEDLQNSFKYLGLALLAATLLVYMVMASQFESFLDPFVILAAVPLAFIGVMLGLFVTGTSLSITALIGGVLLVGIVVNNGIVLIDYINQLREKHGMALQEAIILGGRTRLRPVLMTAITTILSMVPLALGIGAGSEVWAPMARAVIGGLTVSTFLTLLIVPTLYNIAENMVLKRAKKKLAKRQSR